jgi:hypothetical protein
MYSPAAWPPCQPKITPVKATPMLIQTADSMAASLVEGACGLRCTSSRSTTSSNDTNARNATQIHGATSKLAKFSLEPDDSDASRAVDDRDTTYLRLCLNRTSSRRSRPPQGPDPPGRREGLSARWPY